MGNPKEVTYYRKLFDEVVSKTARAKQREVIQQFYVDKRLVTDQEEVLVISLSEAYECVLNLKELDENFKKNLKGEYDQLDRLGFRKERLEPFFQKVLEAYVASLEVPTKVSVTSRTLDLYDEKGRRVERPFLRALAITRKKIGS